MRCLTNGETVTADAWRERKLISWNPPWIFIGILGGLLSVLLWKYGANLSLESIWRL